MLRKGSSLEGGYFRLTFLPERLRVFPANLAGFLPALLNDVGAFLDCLMAESEWMLCDPNRRPMSISP
jgi:hypothetical protein